MAIVIAKRHALYQTIVEVFGVFIAGTAILFVILFYGHVSTAPSSSIAMDLAEPYMGSRVPTTLDDDPRFADNANDRRARAMVAGMSFIMNYWPAWLGPTRYDASPINNNDYSFVVRLRGGIVTDFLPLPTRETRPSVAPSVRARLYRREDFYLNPTVVEFD